MISALNDPALAGVGLAGVGLVEEVLISTLGDSRTDVAITTLVQSQSQAGPGRPGGVFAAEVQAAVLDGRADAAVHSAKDLPSTTVAGLVAAAYLPRADSADVLVGSRLDDLPSGSRIATGSARRLAQLAWLRPDLTFTDLRGNIATRLAKARDHGAVVMAAAALDRLGLSDRVAERLDPDLVVPQAGQGAVVVECRATDVETLTRLAPLDHAPTRRAVECERAFLAAVGAGCDSPVGAHAVAGDDGRLRLTATVASLGGRVLLVDRGEGVDPVALGAEVAERLLVNGGEWLLRGEAVGAVVPAPGG